jgi:hypothetical protein
MHYIAETVGIASVAQTSKPEEPLGSDRSISQWSAQCTLDHGTTGVAFRDMSEAGTAQACAGTRHGFMHAPFISGLNNSFLK